MFDTGVEKNGDRMSEGRRVVGLFGVAAVVYANAMLCDFTMDDNLYILTNSQIKELSLRALVQPTNYNNVFRPVTFATFAINWAFGGTRPFGYHLLNVIAHALVGVLLYLCLKELLEFLPQGSTVAWVAAVVFAVHPIHTEAVTSITGRSEILATGFLLAAWILHLRNRLFYGALCFVLALLSKESAIVFVPLVVVGDYLRDKWKPVRSYATYVGVALAYVAMLWSAQGGRFGEKNINFLDNPLAHLSASLRVLNALRIAWKYIGLQVFPETLSCDYSYNAILLYSSWRHAVLAAAGTLLLIGLTIWAWRTKRTAWVLAAVIYVIGFSVTLNILLPVGTIMGERLAYLPSIGFCLLVALIWRQIEVRSRSVAWGLLLFVVLGFSVRTVARNQDWHDNLRLFSAGVRAVPGSAKMHCNLAIQYYYGGQVDAAYREAETALSIYPDLPDALGYEGLIAASRGQDQEGRVLLERALSMTSRDNPNFDFIGVNLGAVLVKAGDYDGALKLLNELIERDPGNSRAFSNRAVAHFQQNEFELARLDAQNALSLDSANSQARNVLQLLARRAP